MTGFVNPYTFVAFTAQPDRGEPAGHERLTAGNVSGRLQVTLRARTPLLIGGFGQVPDADRTSEEGTAQVQDLPRRADGTVIIPGAGLLGAVRALHEALTGSCLRVLNRDFVPVHRQPANTKVTNGLQLAVVQDVDGAGRPVQVALASRWVWVRQDLAALAKTAAAELPTTGDRLAVDETQIVASRGRDVVAAAAVTRTSGLSTARDGSWLLLVTDTRARSDKFPVYFAAGKLDPTATTCDVAQTARDTYQFCVDGTEDMRLLRQGSGERNPVWAGQDLEPTAVMWPPDDGRPSATPRTPIGYRLPARPYLYPGQPVWVRVFNNTVVELRLSQLWRQPGAGPVDDRIGQGGPCRKPDHLCLSCRLFGSVDPERRDADAEATQFAYRGHVRVEDAVAEGPVDGVPWDLAPLASPKPSAGQFYLDHAGFKAIPVAAQNDQAAASWGSVADRGPAGWRPIRGRKFYWRTTDPTGGPSPRGRARKHHSDKLTRRVRLIPAGTLFKTQVSFDNLTPAQLGSLIAALQPGRLLDGDGHEVVTSVGGGKPFGFGAISVTVNLDTLDTAGSRYLGQAPPRWEIAELVDRFRRATPDHVRFSWSDLAAALTLGAVPDELVWYPPTAGNDKRGSKAYDQGFDFWQKSAGVTLSKEIRPLVLLPHPGEPDQVLDSAVSVTRREKPNP